MQKFSCKFSSDYLNFSRFFQSLLEVLNILYICETDVRSYINVLLKCSKSVVLNRGAVTHKRAPDDSQGGSKWLITKIYTISIEIHFKTTKNYFLSNFVLSKLFSNQCRTLKYFWGFCKREGGRWILLNAMGATLESKRLRTPALKDQM